MSASFLPSLSVHSSVDQGTFGTWDGLSSVSLLVDDGSKRAQTAPAFSGKKDRGKDRRSLLESSSLTSSSRISRQGQINGKKSKPSTVQPGNSRRPTQSDPRIDVLHEAYHTSKQRAHELFSSTKSVIPLKLHGQQASRVYSVLSALLYASISMAKVGDLEDFILRKATQLPNSIFDASDWRDLLVLAKEVRNEYCIGNMAGKSRNHESIEEGHDEEDAVFGSVVMDPSMNNIEDSVPPEQDDALDQREQRTQQHLQSLLDKLDKKQVTTLQKQTALVSELRSEADRQRHMNNELERANAEYILDMQRLLAEVDSLKSSMRTAAATATASNAEYVKDIQNLLDEVKMLKAANRDMTGDFPAEHPAATVSASDNIENSQETAQIMELQSIITEQRMRLNALSADKANLAEAVETPSAADALRVSLDEDIKRATQAEEFSGLSSERHDLLISVAKLQKELSDVQKAASADVARHRAEIANIVEEASGAAHRAKQERTKLEDDKACLLSQLEQMRSSSQDLIRAKQVEWQTNQQAALEDLLAQIDSLKQEKEGSQVERGEMQQQLLNIQARLDSATRSLAAAAIESQVKADIASGNGGNGAEAAAEILSLRLGLMRAEESLANAQQQLVSQASERRAAETSGETLRSANRSLTSALADAQTKLQRALVGVEAQRVTRDALSSFQAWELAQTRQALASARRGLDTQSAEAAAARAALVASRSSANNSPRAINTDNAAIAAASAAASNAAFASATAAASAAEARAVAAERESEKLLTQLQGVQVELTEAKRENVLHMIQLGEEHSAKQAELQAAHKAEVQKLTEALAALQSQVHEQLESSRYHQLQQQSTGESDRCSRTGKSHSPDTPDGDRKRGESSNFAVATPPSEGRSSNRSRDSVLVSKYLGKMYSVNAVVLQRMVRGFIGRARVYRRVLKKAAEAKGLLVAVRGTHQGQSGWYSQSGSYYYFSLHEGEFVLLCGPITRSMYDIAVSEMRAAWGPEYRKARSDLCFRVDRLGIHATRMQIEMLTEELQRRDEHLRELQSK